MILEFSLVMSSMPYSEVQSSRQDFGSFQDRVEVELIGDTPGDYTLPHLELRRSFSGLFFCTKAAVALQPISQSHVSMPSRGDQTSSFAPSGRSSCGTKWTSGRNS